VLEVILPWLLLLSFLIDSRRANAANIYVTGVSGESVNMSSRIFNFT